jgi:hypothetical protein
VFRDKVNIYMGNLKLLNKSISRFIVFNALIKRKQTEVEGENLLNQPDE